MSDNVCIMKQLSERIEQFSLLIQLCQWDKLRKLLLDLSYCSDVSSVNIRTINVDISDCSFNVRFSSLNILRLFLRIMPVDLINASIKLSNELSYDNITLSDWSIDNLTLSISRDKVYAESQDKFIITIMLFCFIMIDTYNFSFPSNGFNIIKTIGTEQIEHDIVIKTHCRYSLNKVFECIQNDTTLGSECIMSYIPNCKIVISGTPMELLYIWIILFEQCGHIDDCSFFIR